MEMMVIEVHGVPIIVTHDQMINQLKIHFMKRRNHGGDVLTVIYPTSTPGQAYVIFESDEVPGVLEWSHILEVDDRFYPVRVKKAHLSEVDMPVETTLDLNMFLDRKLVHRCLKCYGFDVTEHNSDFLQLKGSFLKLKALRYDLVQFQRSHEHPSQRISQSTLQNGLSLGYEMEPHGLVPRFVSRDEHTMDAVSQHHLHANVPPFPSSYRDSGSGEALKRNSIKYSSTGSPRYTVDTDTYSTNTNSVVMSQPKTLGNEMLSRRRSPIGDVPSSSLSSLLQHSSPTVETHTSYRDSASGTSLSIQEDTQSSSTSNRPSSSSRGKSSFPVETDVLNFIVNKKLDVLKRIEKLYGTEMVLQDDSGLTEVTFLGKNSEKAQMHFLDIIMQLNTSLRTQEIHLKDYSRSKQDLILQRTKRYRDSGVHITQNNDVLKLVGSSYESYEVKQKILENIDVASRGKLMERGSRSRPSSSLPRHYKTKDQSSITVPGNQAGAAKSYSPSRYQEEYDEGRTQKGIRSTELSRDKSSHQAFSNSESGMKNRKNTKMIPQGADLEKSSPRKRSIKQNLPDGDYYI